MAGATASLVMQSIGAEDVPEVFISVPPSSDAANGHHGNPSSITNLQPVLSRYTGDALATGYSDLSKVQEQSSN